MADFIKAYLKNTRFINDLKEIKTYKKLAYSILMKSKFFLKNKGYSSVFYYLNLNKMKRSVIYIAFLFLITIPLSISAQNNPQQDKKVKAILDSMENAKKQQTTSPKEQTDTSTQKQKGQNIQEMQPLPVDTATQQKLDEMKAQDSLTGKPGKVKRLKEEEKAIKENRKRLEEMEKDETEKRVEFLKQEEERKKQELKQREENEKEVEKVRIENEKKLEKEIKENRKRLEDME